MQNLGTTSSGNAGSAGPAPAGLAHRAGEAEHKLTYRSGFGEELPAAVYRSVLLGFAAMLLIAWLAFGAEGGTDLDLAVATVLFVVFLLLPVILHRVAAARGAAEQPELRRFLEAPFETATGPVPAREVWLQVALIPVALAVAALLIGGVYVWLG